MSERRVTVAHAERLDALVRRSLPGLSRRLVARLIADGAVRVDGRRAGKGTLLRPGAMVTLPDVGAGPAPEPALEVPVVHEDESIVALDKPGGMRGHALDPRERGTVAAFLLARYPEVAAIGTPLAPGLVHRLDTGTSGLQLVARTAAAFAALRGALRTGRVEKRYLAVVTGEPATGRIELPLAHDPADRRRMIPARPGLRAWLAATDVRVLSAAAGGTLVEAVIRTGVTHQVRAHLASRGTPVIGDPLYGGPPGPLAPGRHALHAARLSFPHPADRRTLVLESALPADLVAAFRRLARPAG
jgi:23S rRNA pseudouridine1911/1915/1917 synthase